MGIVRERAMADARAAVREAQFAERRAKEMERRAEIIKANEQWMRDTKAHRERVEGLLQTLIDEVKTLRISMARRR